MKKSKTKAQKNKLQQRINELIEFALSIVPDADVSVLDPYEQEDAVVEFLVPSEKLDELEPKVRRKAHEIWWDDGFEIVVWVHERKPVATG